MNFLQLAKGELLNLFSHYLKLVQCHPLFFLYLKGKRLLICVASLLYDSEWSYVLRRSTRLGLLVGASPTQISHWSYSMVGVAVLLLISLHISVTLQNWLERPLSSSMAVTRFLGKPVSFLTHPRQYHLSKGGWFIFLILCLCISTLADCWIVVDCKMTVLSLACAILCMASSSQA